MIEERLTTRSLENLLERYLQIVELEFIWCKNNKDYTSECTLVIGSEEFSLDYICKKE
jgi:hypothetical protein